MPERIITIKGDELDIEDLLPGCSPNCSVFDTMDCPLVHGRDTTFCEYRIANLARPYRS